MIATGYGLGVVRPGISTPAPRRKTPEACAEHGHPGVTYNPWLDRTWCLCGGVIHDGNQFTHAACCSGPLEQVRSGQDGRPR